MTLDCICILSVELEYLVELLLLRVKAAFSFNDKAPSPGLHRPSVNRCSCRSLSWRAVLLDESQEPRCQRWWFLCTSLLVIISPSVASQGCVISSNSTTWPYLSASEQEQCWLRKGPSLQFISFSELKHGHCSASSEDGTEMPEGDTDGESVWWPLEAGTEWTGRRVHPLTAHFDQSSNMAGWVRKLELTYKLYYEVINVWILLWGD